MGVRAGAWRKGAKLVSTSFISPAMAECAADILKWARESLAVENEHLHRPRGNQVVCPFVGPAMDNDSFYLAFHPEVGQHCEQLIEQIMMSYIPQSSIISGPRQSFLYE